MRPQLFTRARRVRFVSGNDAGPPGGGYLMEINAAYCDVIVKRWESFASKKAERRAAPQSILETA